MKKFGVKRTVSILLAAGMAVSGSSSAAAETDYEAVITKVRECFDLPEDITEVDINQYGDSTGISWNDYDNDREYTATADKHGCITYFYSYDDTAEKAEKLTREQAQAVADKLISSVYGENSRYIVLDSRRVNSSEVNFSYSVVKNSVPVDTSIHVEVDRKTGRVESFSGPCEEIFSYSYTDPKNVKLLTSDQIFESYKDSENIELVYNIFYNYEKRERTVKPVYRIKPKNINAVTGDELNPDDPIYARNDAGAVSEDAAKESTAKSMAAVTPAEKQAIEDFQNLIAKEEADVVIKKHFPEIKDYELTNSSTYSDSIDKEPVISLSYNKETETGAHLYASASLDAETGDILSFSSPGDYSEKKDLAEEKAVQTAEKLFKELAPKEYGSGKFKTRFEYKTVYFDRIENDIPVNSQYISVSLDNEYKVIGYEKNWKKLSFPALKNLTDERKVFENSKAGGEKFGLIYRLVKETPVLVYAYNGSGYRGAGYSLFDAYTGERINNYNGEPVIEDNNGEYTDIADSPYKETIETLAEYGYVLPYERFEPEQAITVEDFYKFMGSEPVYTDVRSKWYSGKRGLFTEKQGQQPLTKNDLAKIFVEAEGYEELAGKDIFVNPFTDIEKDEAGYAVIASALGLIPEKAGEFNGSQIITRGQAAEYIYGNLASRDML